MLVNRDFTKSVWSQLNDPNTEYYTELLNISSVFEDIHKTIIATSVDGPNLPYIFIMDNFGCIPGRGLLNSQCSSCVSGFYSDKISYEKCIPCESGRASNTLGQLTVTLVLLENILI